MILGRYLLYILLVFNRLYKDYFLPVCVFYCGSFAC